MKKDIFICYSRRDQEFVTCLARDLNKQVAGVWFDQSAIQVGQRAELVEPIVISSVLPEYVFVNSPA